MRQLGTFPHIQATPTQAAFLAANEVANSTVADLCLYGRRFFRDCRERSYPRGSRVFLRRLSPPDCSSFLPLATQPLLQLPGSLCTGPPASFQTLVSQEGNFPVFEGTSLYSLRIDHNLSANNRLTLRGNVSPSTVTGLEVSGEDQPFGQNAYSRTSQQTFRDVAGVAQDTWTLGNNKVNEFRFQFARRGLAYFYNTQIPGGTDPAVNIPASPTSDVSLTPISSASKSATSSPTIFPGPWAATTPNSASTSTTSRSRPPSP